MSAFTQLSNTIEILEETDEKIVDLYDSYGPGNEDLMNFVRDEIEKVINKTLKKKWTDSIGQPMN